MTATDVNPPLTKLSASEFVVLAGGVFATVGLTAIAILKGPRDLAVAVTACVVAACIWFALRVEVAKLPAVSLVAFALFPASYLPLPTHQGGFNPAVLVVVLFLFRAIAADRPIQMGAHLVPLTLMLGWVVIATIASPHPITSLSWSANFVILVGVPAFLLPGWERACRYVKDTWIALGGLLGAYGVVEFALGRNPLLGSVYSASIGAASGSPHRITTTLGHPITNGLFFALALILGISAVARGRRGYVVPSTLLSALGLLFSFSRGPLVAAVLGCCVLGLALAMSPARETSARTLLIGSVLLASLGGAGYILVQARGSAASSSTASHLETLQSGDLLVREFLPWGGGPGLADRHKRDLPSGDKARGVESSPYQLAISLGIPGILFSAWLFLAGLWVAVRRHPEIAGCIVAYLAATAGYNLLETNRPALLLWGLLLGMALGGVRHKRLPAGKLAGWSTNHPLAVAPEPSGASVGTR